MKKLMIVMSLLLGVSVVLLGGRSYAQYTQDNSYWDTAFQGMGPVSQGPAEGFDQAPVVSEYQAINGGLSAFAPEFSEGTVESAHQPSRYDEITVGGMSPFSTYSGQ